MFREKIRCFWQTGQMPPSAEVVESTQIDCPFSLFLLLRQKSMSATLLVFRMMSSDLSNLLMSTVRDLLRAAISRRARERTSSEDLSVDKLVKRQRSSRVNCRLCLSEERQTNGELRETKFGGRRRSRITARLISLTVREAAVCRS